MENGIFADILQRVDVAIVSDSDCKTSYGSLFNPKFEICAGIPAGGKGPCQGDSGGPLIANGKQVGIVSWGAGCAQPSYPAVYAEVAAFRDWITENAGV